LNASLPTMAKGTKTVTVKLKRRAGAKAKVTASAQGVAKKASRSLRRAR
jgi:hypothetical protein